MSNGEAAGQVANNLKQIPTGLWTIFEYIIFFWFGGRAAQHVMTQFAEGRVKEKKSQAQAEIEVAKEKTRQIQIESGVVLNSELPSDDFTEEEKRHAFRKFHSKLRR